ncbi:hypothetical protein ACQKWADRAFT_280808 [Trichoderma austrokoningii]
MSSFVSHRTAAGNLLNNPRGSVMRLEPVLGHFSSRSSLSPTVLALLGSPPTTLHETSAAWDGERCGETKTNALIRSQGALPARCSAGLAHKSPPDELELGLAPPRQPGVRSGSPAARWTTLGLKQQKALVSCMDVHDYEVPLAAAACGSDIVAIEAGEEPREKKRRRRHGRLRTIYRVQRMYNACTTHVQRMYIGCGHLIR